jgi:ankyrin repeat protein
MLIEAIRKQKSKLVTLLLKYGADPNYKLADNGDTALHEACKQLKEK